MDKEIDTSTASALCTCGDDDYEGVPPVCRTLVIYLSVMAVLFLISFGIVIWKTA